VGAGWWAEVGISGRKLTMGWLGGCGLCSDSFVRYVQKRFIRTKLKLLAVREFA